MLRTSFSNHEIMRALYQNDYTIRLFANLSEALTYKYLAADKYYDKSMDVYDIYARPAVYVISLNNNLLVKGKKLNLKSGDESKAFDLLETPAKNCKQIFFSKLHMPARLYFFAPSQTVNFPEEFFKLWHSAFERGLKDVQQIVSRAVNNLFTAYSELFFANIRCHHQKEVEFILENLKKNMTINELYDFLKKLRKAEKVKLGVDEQGQYCKMLDFAIIKIDEVQQAAKLDQIDSYYRDGMRR
jgi:hypothetical protein